MENTLYSNLICKSCQEKYPKCEIRDGKNKWNHRKFCPACFKNQKTSFKSKVSDEAFIKAVKENSSIHSVLQAIGLKPAGGNYSSFYKRVELLNIDTSHFLGHASNKGKKFGPKRPLEDYLSNKFSIASCKLKTKLIKEGLKTHYCEECKLDSWRGEKIPLELHHINGDHFDNQLSNLKLLCPNCHSFTSNYRGKNIKSW